MPDADEVVFGQKTFALGSLIDGTWAHRIGNVGRYHRASDGMLASIYADEMGRGDLRKNHITLIHQVLRSMDIDVPHIRDVAFLDQDELPDHLYGFSIHQVCLALFPDSRYPEILGYNLGIEMFGLGEMRLHEMAKLSTTASTPDTRRRTCRSTTSRPGTPGSPPTSSSPTSTTWPARWVPTRCRTSGGGSGVGTRPSRTSSSTLWCATRAPRAATWNWCCDGRHAEPSDAARTRPGRAGVAVLHGRARGPGRPGDRVLRGQRRAVATADAAPGGRARADRLVLRRLGAAGLLSFLDPDGHPDSAGPDGSGDGDLRSLCLAREALAYADDLADFALSIQALSATPLLRHGTPEQRRRYLPGMAAGVLQGAFAISEPQAGSDVAAVATRADRDGDGCGCTAARRGSPTAAPPTCTACSPAPARAPARSGSARSWCRRARPASGSEPVATLAPRALAHLDFDGVRTCRPMRCSAAPVAASSSPWRCSTGSG